MIAPDWHYLNKGRFVTGWATVGSNKYYFGADGKMVTNKLYYVKITNFICTMTNAEIR